MGLWFKKCRGKYIFYDKYILLNTTWNIFLNSSLRMKFYFQERDREHCETELQD